MKLLLLCVSLARRVKRRARVLGTTRGLTSSRAARKRSSRDALFIIYYYLLCTKSNIIIECHYTRARAYIIYNSLCKIVAFIITT